MKTKSDAENELNLIIFDVDRVGAHLSKLEESERLCAERDLDAIMVAAWKIKKHLQKVSEERGESGEGCNCQGEGTGCCKK